MPKISVLVPIYNVEKYLRQCLDSLVNQTLKDIEILCINDGSTDSCKQIIEDYRANDDRIKLIDKANSGYGDSMNKGIELATGDYIGILEPDDFTELNMYEELYNIALKNPEINMIKSDWYWYLTSNNLSRKAGKIKKDGIINVKKYQKILKHQSIWTCLYKRDFLNKNNIRFLTTPKASYQDTSFAFKTAVLAENIYLVKKAFVHYRMDNEHSSINSSEKAYYICDEHEEIAKFLDCYPNIKPTILATQRIIQYRAYRKNLIRIDDKFKDRFLKRFQDTFKNYQSQNTIPSAFFKRIDKKEFEMLLTNIEEYKKFILELQEKSNKRFERSKKFSVRINRSRVSVVLFGKQIVEVG